MGTSIGNVLISYDVSDKNPEVKKALIEKGYFDNFAFATRPPTYYLPNTTLWHNSKSTDQAMLDMKNVAVSLKVTLEKAVAVRASEFVGL